METAHTMTDIDESLQAGADLWICADPESSAWTRRIDWYLNSQIMRAECRQQPAVPSELLRIEQEWGCDRPTIAVEETAPLMIASSRLLPNRQTVMVPFSGGSASWVKSCARIWKEMNRPSTRVFLPEAISLEEFEKAWPKKDGLVDVRASRGNR